MTEKQNSNGVISLDTKCCQNCRWWMYEDEQMEWNHESAVQENKGFCVIKDLFTYTESSDVCGEYCKE